MHDSDFNAKMRAIKESVDQAFLADVASTEPDENLRCLATVKLIDHSILIQLAKQDPSPEIRRVAVEKIVDQVTLANSALNDSDPSVRCAAILKVTNQEALSEISCGNSGPTDAVVATSRLIGKKQLEKTARRARLPAARQRAVEMLTDEQVVSRVFRLDSDVGVRLSAAYRLVELVTKSKSLRPLAIKEAVSKKLVDEAVCVFIVGHSDNDGFRNEAMAAITNRSVLKELAVQHFDSAVRRAALEKLGLQKELANSPRYSVDVFCSALEDSDVIVRRRATEILLKAGDRKAIEPLCKVLGDPDRQVRRVAVEALQKIGDARAVGPLLRVLNSGSEDDRRSVCQALASLYRSGKLDTWSRLRILARRRTLNQDHEDRKVKTDSVDTSDCAGHRDHADHHDSGRLI
jgi:hypothetical protein